MIRNIRQKLKLFLKLIPFYFWTLFEAKIEILYAGLFQAVALAALKAD